MTGDSARVWILGRSGSSDGETWAFDQDRISMGRHPNSDLQFDPSIELEVSAHHATLARHQGDWLIRDLDSRNGTYVNGSRIQSECGVRHGDQIRLGIGGPEIAIWFSPPGVDGSVPRAALANPYRLRWALLATLLLIGITGAALLRSNRSKERIWRLEQTQLAVQVDSLLAASNGAVATLQSDVTELRDSLRASQETARGLVQRLAVAGTDPATSEINNLRRQLQDAMVRLERHQLAASIDFDAIRRDTEPAVAMLWSEWDDGTVSTGTAVSIAADGTLLTNRHLVTRAGGMDEPSRRLAVQFAGSIQIWRAELLNVYDDVDLALAKAQGIVGSIPAMPSFNWKPDTLAIGSAVAIVGFPLGGQVGSASPDARRRAVVSAGVIVGQSAEEIRIQGYGAQGASGSAVLDRGGSLIAIVFGAEKTPDGDVLLAVPITHMEPDGA